MAQRPRNKTVGKPGPLAVAMTELGQLVQQVGTLLEQPVESRIAGQWRYPVPQWPFIASLFYT